MNAVAAWGIVLKAIRDQGGWRREEAIRAIRAADPVAAEIVVVQGWETLCRAMPLQLQRERDFFISQYERGVGRRELLQIS